MKIPMTLNLNNTLPNIGKLPDGCSIHTAEDPNTEKGWKVLFPDTEYPASENTFVFLLRQYNQPAATVTAQIADANICELTMIATNKYYYGHHFALHVLLYALNCVREKGFTIVVLSADADNAALLAQAKELGFAPQAPYAEFESAVDIAETPHEVRYLWNGKAPYSDYSPSQAQPSITCFPAKGSKGAVVVVPGGGYAMKADHESTAIANMLNECGVSAFVLDYRVAPCHHAAPLSDANRAIRLVRSLDYEKVGIMGFSAGGNLTACAAVHYDSGNPDSPDPIEHFSSRPDAFIPCYAVVSLGNSTHKGSRNNLLGDFRENESLIRFYSGEDHITDDTPPAFIWHTANDEAVPIANSLILATRLSEHNVPFALHIFPNGPHGLGLAEEYPDIRQWSPLLQQWLIGLGFAK